MRVLDLSRRFSTESLVWRFAVFDQMPATATAELQSPLFELDWSLLSDPSFRAAIALVVAAQVVLLGYILWAEKREEKND